MKKNANSVIGGGGFHHVAIKVVDFDKSVRFYKEALGFKEKIRWMMNGDVPAIMLDTGDGNYLEIFGGAKPDAAATSTPIIHFAIRTDNCDAALKRASDAGAEITMQPKDVNIPSQPGPTPVRIAFCKAPEGVVIEFFQNELT